MIESKGYYCEGLTPYCIFRYEAVVYSNSIGQGVVMFHDWRKENLYFATPEDAALYMLEVLG